MGQRGPKPRPSAIKLLQGRSPGRDSGGRRVASALPFLRQAPEQPPNLSLEARPNGSASSRGSRRWMSSRLHTRPAS